DELVATYGNTVHRTLSFLQSKFGGVVPQPQPLREADPEILAEVEGGFAVVGHNIANYHFKDGINAARAFSVVPQTGRDGGGVASFLEVNRQRGSQFAPQCDL